MRPLLTLAMKDLRLLFRDRVAFVFTFFFPLMIAVFFGYVFAGPREGGAAEIRVLGVDLDASDASRDLLARLDAHRSVAVEIVQGEEEALGAVRAGRRPAAIVVPPGFGEASRGLFFGEAPSVRLATDPSRSAEAAMLQGVLMEVSFGRMQRDFQDPDLMRERAAMARAALAESASVNLPTRLAFDALLNSMVGMAEQIEQARALNDALGAPGAPDAPDDTPAAAGAGWKPIGVETVSVRREGRNRPANPFEVTFPQAMIWGLLGSCYGFAMSLVTERTRGTLTRLRIAPISAGQILASKALACFLAMLLVIVMLLVIGEVFFGVRPQSTPLLLCAIVASAVCFCGMMMLLAVLGRSEASAGGFTWAALLVMAMLGGGMIPLFVMPGWMQRASVVSPVSWAIRALEGAIWRGFTPAQMLGPCAMLVGLGTVCFALGVLGFRRFERR